MAEAVPYIRLTRPASRSIFGLVTVGRSNLWLAPDHLLAVDSNGYSESYKRFYFRDIQAVAVVTTNRRGLWNLVLALPSVVCLAILITGALPGGNMEIGSAIASGVGAAFFGGLIVVNSLRGPTCRCEIRTAVQTGRMPSLRRLKLTSRTLDRLRPLIIGAQGQLTPEEIAARMREWVEPASSELSQTASPESVPGAAEEAPTAILPIEADAVLPAPPPNPR
jgi:hypothetical protein